MRVGGQHHAPAAVPPRKDPVPTVQEAGYAPGLVWKGAENLAPTGIRSPDRPACSESLYRLSYPGPCAIYEVMLKKKKGAVKSTDDTIPRMRIEL